MWSHHRSSTSRASSHLRLPSGFVRSHSTTLSDRQGRATTGPGRAPPGSSSSGRRRGLVGSVEYPDGLWTKSNPRSEGSSTLYSVPPLAGGGAVCSEASIAAAVLVMPRTNDTDGSRTDHTSPASASAGGGDVVDDRESPLLLCDDDGDCRCDGSTTLLVVPVVECISRCTNSLLLPETFSSLCRSRSLNSPRVMRS